MNIQVEVSKLNHWILNENHIKKEFLFSTFPEAIAFIVRVSDDAMRLNHHPEIYNVYNKVTISLSTHDVGGLSELDFALAKLIDLQFVQ